MAIFAAVIVGEGGEGGASPVPALAEMSLSTGSKAAFASSTELLPLFIAHPFENNSSQLEMIDGNVRRTRVVLRPDLPAKEKRRGRRRSERHDRFIMSAAGILPADMIDVSVAIFHEHRAECGKGYVPFSVIRTGDSNPRHAAINLCNPQRGAATMTI